MVALKKFKTENLVKKIKAKHRRISRTLLLHHKFALWDEVEIDSCSGFYPFLKSFSLKINKLTNKEITKFTTHSNGKSKNFKSAAIESKSETKRIRIIKNKYETIGKTKTKKLDEIEKLKKFQRRSLKSFQNPRKQDDSTDNGSMQRKQYRLSKYNVINKKDNCLRLKSILVKTQNKSQCHQERKRVKFSEFEYIRYYECVHDDIEQQYLNPDLNGSS